MKKTACKIGRLGKTVEALCLAFLAGTVFVSSLHAQSLPVRLGDLDADGRPTVLDLVRLVGHVNGSNALVSSLAPFGDINEDGAINTNDLTLLENAILGLASLPNPYAAPVVNAPVTATNGTNILITGTARPNRVIHVQGGQGPVTAIADSNGLFTINVPLQANRVNYLYFTASNGTFTAGIPQPLRIIQDSQPPSLYLDFPTNGQTLFTTNTVIAGRVGDMLSGFMGLNVWVHSSPSEGAPPGPPLPGGEGPGVRANVNVGIGNNGSFERGNVPLALGTNEITVTASDIHGNSTVRVIRLFRGEISGPRLLAFSGDMQMTNIGRRLAQPIVLRVTQADGTTPFANKLVDLQVTRNDGRLLPVDTNAAANPAALTNDITRTANGLMHLQLFTDANGEARAWWTLGGAAGCGNNRVSVTSAGVSNSAYFCASAAPAPVKQINIGTGNNQKAETGAFVTEPLRAWVSDSCNGVESIPVTFTVVQGGGKLFTNPLTPALSPGGGEGVLPSPGGEGQGEGGPSITVTSSITGHAEALLQLAPDAGQNLIEATYPGNPGLPATFIAYGVARDPARPTTFSGLVLDNTSHPIGNAHCELHVGGQTLGTFTDSQGRFSFTNTLAGPASLHVDGLTATSLGTNSIPPGTFPPLHFSFTLIPNADNALPMPVLLPCMNTNNAQVYHGTNDLILTCQGIEGLKMTIRAGSMRKPDGSLVTPANPAVVSLNQVHHDSVPMPMPDGASPPFAWTLQPGGAHFDPPITIEYPNMSGLPAGGLAYFLSYNHDTERFEIVASGHVTDDGSKIITDPNVGLSIAGWGGNCPPYSVTGETRPCRPVTFWSAARAGFQLAKDIAIAFAKVREAINCASSAADAATSCYDAYVEAREGGLDAGEISAILDCANSVKGTVAQCAGLVPDVGGIAGRAQGVSSALAAAIASAQQTVCMSRIANMALDAVNLLNNSLNGALGLVGVVSAKQAATLVACRTGQQIIDVLNLADHGARNPPPNPNGDGPVPGNDTIGQLDQLFAQLQAEIHASTNNDPAILSIVTNTASLTQSENLLGMVVSNTDLTPIAGFNLTINGQTTLADSDGSFFLANITAPDFFGEAGPGTAPDFVSDDYVRMIGQSTVGGTNRYVFSEYFQIRQGQAVNMTNLTVTDIPPRKPESLLAAPENAALVTLGQTTQVRVTARYGDGTSADVSSKLAWTSYRISNPIVATIDENGRVTSRSRGIAFVTAVNEGVTSVCQIDISPGDPLTEITGFVQTTNGTPAAGVNVKVVGAAGSTVSGVDGAFRISGVATRLGIQAVIAFSTNTGVLFGIARNLQVVPGGITDAGIIMVESLCTNCPDADADRLPDALEVLFGTDSGRPDTDGDTLGDYDEVFVHGTDPRSRDTDLDGLDDREEIFVTLTDPFRADTDGDGWADGDEIADSKDPLDSASRPQILVVAGPPIEIMHPSVTGSLGVIVAAPPVEIVSPGEQGSAYGITVAFPPVEVVFPGEAGGAFGVIVAWPLVEVVMPGEAGATLGVIVARPPVDVIMPCEVGGALGVIIAQPPVVVVHTNGAPGLLQRTPLKEPKLRAFRLEK